MKMLKKSSVLALIAAMLLSFAGCGVQKTGEGLVIPPWIDFESEMDNFAEDYFNSLTMEVGDRTSPTSWLSGPTLGGWLCGAASSDESVVTVAENGTIKAVGKGTAYVIYWGMFMTKTYLVEVTDSSAENTIWSDLQEKLPDYEDLMPDYEDIVVSEGEETEPEVEEDILQQTINDAIASYDSSDKKILFVGETTSRILWVQESSTLYSQDSSIVSVSDGNVLTAHKEGVTYVVEVNRNGAGKAYQVVVKDATAFLADAQKTTWFNEMSMFVGETQLLSDYRHVAVMDESVLELKHDGSVTALKKGETYAVVFYEDSTNKFDAWSVYKITVK